MASGSVLFGALNGDLINLASAMTPNEHPFMYFVADETLFSNNATVGVCSVELPYASGAHLVGIPTHPAAVMPLKFELEDFQHVTLEGNFNSAFSLYVVLNLQSEARSTLDPART